MRTGGENRPYPDRSCSNRSYLNRSLGMTFSVVAVGGGIFQVARKTTPPTRMTTTRMSMYFVIDPGSDAKNGSGRTANARVRRDAPVLKPCLAIGRYEARIPGVRAA